MPSWDRIRSDMISLWDRSDVPDKGLFERECHKFCCNVRSQIHTSLMITYTKELKPVSSNHGIDDMLYCQIRSGVKSIKKHRITLKTDGFQMIR